MHILLNLRRILLLLLLQISEVYSRTRYYEFNLTQEYYAHDGVYKSVKAINGMSPGPTLIGDENDWVEILVNNQLEVRAAIHFHGILQVGTPWSDGVPGVTQYPIPSGGNFTYRFQLKNQSGAMWYHSHYRGYLSDGLYGMIYIRPSPRRKRPYHLITNISKDLEMLYRLEKTPSVLIADDAFRQNMDDIMARMFHFGVDPVCIQSLLINGKGRVYCHSHERFYTLAKKKPFLKRVPYFDSMGCLRDDSFLKYNDHTLDHFALELPGYSLDCKSTLSENFIFFTNGSRWQYVNFLNAGGQYTKAFSIDDHKFYVIAVDGAFVFPQKVTSVVLPVGSRMTVCFETKPEQHESTHKPFAIRVAAIHTPQFIEAKALLVYGKREDFDEDDIRGFQEYNELNNGKKFQDVDGFPTNKHCKWIWPHHTHPYEKENQLHKIEPADVTFKFFLNRTDMVKFSMFEDWSELPSDFEVQKPMLHQLQDGTLNVTKSKAYLQPPVKLGQIVDFIINNYKRINHPIHMHGHYVHILSFSDQENFPYNSIAEAKKHKYPLLNLDNPPFSDVVMAAVGGHVVLRITANNPGIWLLHCHNIGHLLGGMGAVLFESLEEIPSLEKLPSR